MIILCVAIAAVFLSGEDPREFDTYTEISGAYDEKLIEFDADWSVASEDSLYRHVELPFSLKVPKNATVVAFNRLSPSLTDGTLLAFRYFPCFVEVCVGKETVYSFPVTVTSTGKGSRPCLAGYLSLWSGNTPEGRSP